MTNYMNIRYNVTGAERKRLAEAIAEFLGCEKKYLGMPSAAYQIGYIEVSKEGTISFDDRADSEEIENLLETLEQKDFHAEPVEENTDDLEQNSTLSVTAETGENTESHDITAEIAEPDDSEQTPAAEAIETKETSEAPQDISLTISVPLEKVNAGNLTSLLDAKGSLIKKALGIPATPIEITGDAVLFPWFSHTMDADISKACTDFISALCAMSLNLKRVTAKEKEVDNEKYAFRCFLLRLGFIGPDFKADRKILLQNLSGSSAFKSGSRSNVEGGEPHEEA